MSISKSITAASSIIMTARANAPCVRRAAFSSALSCATFECSSAICLSFSASRAVQSSSDCGEGVGAPFPIISSSEPPRAVTIAVIVSRDGFGVVPARILETVALGTPDSSDSCAVVSSLVSFRCLI